MIEAIYMLVEELELSELEELANFVKNRFRELELKRNIENCPMLPVIKEVDSKIDTIRFYRETYPNLCLFDAKLLVEHYHPHFDRGYSF